ncbi:1,3-beta-D-glucan synthase, partial [Spiromyces aspiralis]
MRFADASIYFGMRLMMLLCYFSLAYWKYSMIYFWVTIAALCVTPYLYNPHQFVMTDFILDYRDWLRWLGAGNHSPNPNSWIAHCRLARIRITGYKRKRLGEKTPSSGHVPRASKGVIATTEILLPVIFAIVSIIPYMYVNSKQTETSKGYGSPLVRIVIFSVAPVA